MRNQWAGGRLRPDRWHVDLALGIIKGFYETRVGEGPFPTEMGGEESAKWCAKANREAEEVKFGQVSVNDPDEFRQGVAIRFVGRRIGATTKRPRRTGWLDLPLLRHSMRWSGKDVVLTKLDVLNDCETIKVCDSYVYEGPAYSFGDKTLEPGTPLKVAIPAAEVLAHCRPVYTSFPGWKTSLKGITNSADLPDALLGILNYVMLETGINPRIISIGKDREETIFV